MRTNILASVVLVIFVASAIGLFLWVGNHAETYFRGQGFESRFPEKTLSYSENDLRMLVKSDIRSSYISPILFPLDLAVMLALSISLGAASFFWARQLYPTLAQFALLLPAIYLLSDMIEDGLLIWLLRRGDPDTAASALLVLKAITAIKLATITGAFIQTALAFVVWL